jgi:phage baseplate assembly protein gpV
VASLATLLILGLAACRSGSEPLAKTPGTSADACGAAALQTLVGQDRAAVPTVDPAQDIRVFQQGAALTMDFKANRLNVELDDGGTILRVYCG